MSRKPEQTEAFADGIERISVQGTTVRVDFVSLEPSRGGGQAKVAARRRIILPLSGFVASHRTMQQTIERLVESGALQVDGGNDEEPAP